MRRVEDRSIYLIVSFQILFDFTVVLMVVCLFDIILTLLSKIDVPSVL